MTSYRTVLLLILAGCAKEPLFTDAGTFMDSRDNHVYKSVKIGEQVWMAENLAWLPSVSPSMEGSATNQTYYVLRYEGYLVEVAKGR